MALATAVDLDRLGKNELLSLGIKNGEENLKVGFRKDLMGKPSCEQD